MNIQQRTRARIAGLALLAIVFAGPAYSSDELNQQLFEFVSYNEPAEISRLIKEGADPNHMVTGIPVITLAASTSSLDAIKALLAGGADPNARDEYGKTVLMYAAEIGEINVIKILLENKADPNLKQEGSGDTALLKLLKGSPTVEVITALLDGGADVNLADDSGLTPLASAELHTAPPEVVELLTARSKGK
jgi:uncharacterized protein